MKEAQQGMLLKEDNHAWGSVVAHKVTTPSYQYLTHEGGSKSKSNFYILLYPESKRQSMQ